MSLQVFRDDNGSLQVRGAVIASEVWSDKWALTSLFSGFRSAQVNGGEWRDASLLFVVAIETARSAPGWQASRLGWMGDVTALAPGSLLGFVWTIWEKNQSTAMQSYASECALKATRSYEGIWKFARGNAFKERQWVEHLCLENKQKETHLNKNEIVARLDCTISLSTIQVMHLMLVNGLWILYVHAK